MEKSTGVDKYQTSIIDEANSIRLKVIYERCFPMAWLTAPEHKVETIWLN